MARKCLIEKANRDPKYKTRKYNRCKLCGRRRAYYRKFQTCRICFRMLSLKGEIPGVKKASW
ncbi:30S ribosomal subunit protein S14 [Candidatus Kuenenia stuttgartiensis]|jgi:small subunit ribosomal protein S14|uniref:Small ribosomal subunit protein uS14 n=1 Tax=Kuenenia stuttgartiensis TaxID=174633 RepID=Q1Q144_KUEST|nr:MULTISPECIES: type Z 30S ribosomal protein S14 [Kuenenia]MBE7547835.1 type Z 30S ribosomal protein S14 [Planctomycetia bacterium]MBZ0191190.1 type Z 30S ribosomal protein S14 [Candidatus Kuenenia stuttgartiensis]MCF6152378.1 type Z 30S ribosomal protein S14 [Candidatus Kuenenia stuttgartiensis]MCL4726125.1 type Z 30S ribosomal protein S14 [Candidatus Kuenenia stuttgartiensis]MCZ7623641.1 type Z 30S ribosomal protein S14 [Candidatus Kuenenia sp.]